MFRLAVLAAAVLSCVRADADLPWWKVGPIYQIFPASFADSDGDGWGDLQGIIDHVDYLDGLGVGAIWLSPIYPSPMKDNGYDVLNFREVNPRFGNLAVFDNLIKTFHDKKIKVVLDFVPNHTSNESVWFQDSVHRRNGKDNWFVWRDPKGFDSAAGKYIPPNNWVSTFGGSAWEYVPERKQFYYHKFAPYQTDLDYSNPAVLEEMKETLRFWLNRGVDGFRMDAVPFIAETNYTLNEPVLTGCNQDTTNDCLNHIYTMNLQLTHDVLDSFDAVLREGQFNSTSRAMWEEANNDVPQLMTYYGNVSSPFNFQYITYMARDWNASQFQKYTKEFMDALDGRWPNWVVGNHDNPRIGTRMGSEMIDSMNIITQLLPGTSITYYGEEIGMENTKNIIEARRKDWATNPSRDPSRTPMQWNLSTNAGFSSAASKDLYLPVNPNYFMINVQNESVANSHLDFYKKVVKMHKDNIGTTQKGFETGTFGQWIFAFQRDNLNYLHAFWEVSVITDCSWSVGERFRCEDIIFRPYSMLYYIRIDTPTLPLLSMYGLKMMYSHRKRSPTTAQLEPVIMDSPPNRPGLVVVTNLNNEEETFSMNDLKLNKTDSLTVALAPRNDAYNEGKKIASSDKITLRPRSTIVFTTGGAGYLQISYLLLASCFLLLWRTN